LEAQAFELEQKTALVAEAKTVLDSWVRYEGQVKQRQQRELAESIIAKVEKELEDPKVLKQILDQSIKDVESKKHLLVSAFPVNMLISISFRDCYSKSRVMYIAPLTTTYKIKQSFQRHWKCSLSCTTHDMLDVSSLVLCWLHLPGNLSVT